MALVGLIQREHTTYLQLSPIRHRQVKDGWARYGRSASPSLSLKPMFEPLTPVMHGSYETAAAPAESSRKKQFRIFRLPCAGGGRILPYFSGIIVVSSDMTYHFTQLRTGIAEPL